jgi:hypothetical protein
MQELLRNLSASTNVTFIAHVKRDQFMCDRCRFYRLTILLSMEYRRVIRSNILGEEMLWPYRHH